MPDYSQQTPAQARNSIKSLNAELSNLTPSSMVTMFEIDISELVKDSDINLATDAAEQGISQGNYESAILRFHNNIKVFNSTIVWQGKVYYPAPITSTGFETNTKGSLPTPTLSISVNSENGIDQLALLRYEIKKIGDIIGAKVTRKRTFAKYLDKANFGTSREARISKESNMLPEGYEPDPYAYLPDDIYYVERKQTENKLNIVYQLSSVLDLEGTRLPKRVVLSNKCVWQYRGIGCWYQAPATKELQTYNSNNTSTDVPIPLLKKARLKTLRLSGDIETNGGDTISATSNAAEKLQGCGMLRGAPPVATDSNDDIQTEAQGNRDNQDYEFADQGEYNPQFKQARTTEEASQMGYKIGNYVWVLKNGVKYYYVCKRNMEEGNNVSPPNSDYWVADECSKSLTGCRLRWGAKNRKSANKGGCQISMGDLPYGGFPAANSISRGLG
jgi:lambda family phage minor tail protein L